MAGLRNTLSSIVQSRKLQSRKLFSPLETMPTLLSQANRRNNITAPADATVEEVRNFGTNPGNLRMLTFVPAGLRPRPALVVVLHGCMQQAANYARDTGWLDLAASRQFVVVAPEQKRVNNPNVCWNWFQPQDIERDRGEVFSIWEMVEKAIVDHAIDRERVYVTGLSAGGAMACALLATYPDVFAGGAIVAGLPYRSAANVQQALAAMAHPQPIAPRILGDLVRSASLHRGPWPVVTIWQGAADRTVAPANAEILAQQWCDVHGVADVGYVDDVVAGQRRRTWRSADGRVAVERMLVQGLAHGTPIDARGAEGEPLGRPAPFVLDARISSTRLIAERWGLIRVQDGSLRTRGSARPLPVRSGANVLEAAAHDALSAIRRVLPGRQRK